MFWAYQLKRIAIFHILLLIDTSWNDHVEMISQASDWSLQEMTRDDGHPTVMIDWCEGHIYN